MKAPGTAVAAASLLFLLAAGGLGFAEQSLFRSNSIGMQLEPLARYRADEYEWTLRVEVTGDREVRRLFDHGAEARRWEKAPAPGGKRTEEKEYDSGALSARRVYGEAGELILEERYSDGRLVSRSIPRYSGARLTGVRTVAADGKLVSVEEYELSTRGSLREVRRTSPEGPAASARYIMGRNGPVEERDTVGELTYVTRFDAESRAVEKEKRKGSELLVRQDFTFRSGSSVLASSTERDSAAGTLTQREYDEKGRLAAETVRAGEQDLSRTEFSWDGDRMSGKRRRSAAGLEEWRYTYGADGELSREEYLSRGSREKVTLHTGKDERTEELYRDGELFLKVFYRDETRTREEVYEGDTLVRTRSFP
jgi:YD repeat-containing protein